MSSAVQTTNLRAGMSGPNLWLRLEGLAVLVTAVVLFGQTEMSWWLFVLLLLAPDLAMVGYLLNPRVGALVYNLFHNYAIVLVVLGVATYGGPTWLWAVGLIWLAHIGMDRLVGYGFKYGDQFKHTHLDEV